MTHIVRSLAIFSIFITFTAGCQPTVEQAVVSKPVVAVRSSSGEAVTPALNDIVDNYKSRYTDTLRVDTVFETAAGRETIMLRHYCLHDSALAIDDRYTAIFGIRNFVTHNFVSSLKIKVDERLVLDTVITREMFLDSLFDALQRYGGLTSPVVRLQGNIVVVVHSLSIPLTDVGEEVLFPVSPQIFKKQE
nr:hypothetical protein [uncultured Chitinophaga sp.]